MSFSKIMSIPPEAQRKKLFLIFICAALALLTIIVYWPVKDYDFINLDDNIYVYENSYVQSGLNWGSIKKAFSTELAGKIGFWHPVTWLSLILDYQIFGLNPHGYHLINLLFHVLNTILLFLIFHRMTRTLWQSAFVACLFAVHPLHVESVAWVAERKDVLSAFFWMLTMGAYIHYVERPGLRRYLPVPLFFVLGLMAKAMLVTLPFVLLLLDYWPLHRLQEIKADYKFQWSLIRPLLWEKCPLFALAVISSIVTYIAAQKAAERAVGSVEVIPVSIRIANAFVSYISYMGKMIWPNNLAVIYPYPGMLPLWQVLGAFLLLIGITLIAIWTAKRFPYLTVGWLWYVGTLVPVIGIVQFGSQLRADRYTYIPLIGLFMMVVWVIPELLKKWRYRKEALFASSALTISCFFIVTWIQVGYWQNSITLFDHTLKITSGNSLVYFDRGSSYQNLGNYKQAIEDYDRAIEINPNYTMAYINRGVAYSDIGNYKQAITDFDRAIKIDPNHTDAYYNRGTDYAVLGNYKQAIEDFNKVIQIDPKYADAYSNRGFAYNALGNQKQAIEDLRTAARLGSENAKNILRSNGINW